MVLLMGLFTSKGQGSVRRARISEGEKKKGEDGGWKVSGAS